MTPRPLRPRGDRTYDKPALAPDDLVARLESRGLEMPDRERALRYLRHIGYYRLSPYVIPFRVHPSRDDLRPGTTFDDVLDLYVFDRRLRLLVLDAIERVEVAVRAAVTDRMSTEYDDPFWYTDVRHFARHDKHQQLLDMVRRSVGARQSAGPEHAGGDLRHRSALEHYLTTYREPELPPSWVMIETLTIGQLNSLLGNLER